MPRLLLSGFNLDRQHRWAAILPAPPRGQAGVLPPATLATKCGVYCYTGFVLVAPVDRGEVGLTRRARCLAQGRSVGGAAGAAHIPPPLDRAIPAVICLGQSGASDEPPLPIMHPAYNSLHSASDSRSLGLRLQNGGSAELSTSATMSLVGHRLTGAWHCRRSDFHPIPLLPVTSPEGLLGWEAERFTGCRHPGLRRDWKASPTCATIIPQAAGAARKLPAETRRFTGLNQGEIDDNPDKPTAV